MVYHLSKILFEDPILKVLAYLRIHRIGHESLHVVGNSRTQITNHKMPVLGSFIGRKSILIPVRTQGCGQGHAGRARKLVRRRPPEPPSPRRGVRSGAKPPGVAPAASGGVRGSAPRCVCSMCNSTLGNLKTFF